MDKQGMLVSPTLENVQSKPIESIDHGQHHVLERQSQGQNSRSCSPRRKSPNRGSPSHASERRGSQQGDSERRATQQRGSPQRGSQQRSIQRSSSQQRSRQRSSSPQCSSQRRSDHSVQYLPTPLQGTTGATSGAKPNTTPLKNGNDLGESGFRRKYKQNLPFAVITIFLFLLLIGFIIITVLYALILQRKPVQICRSKECLRSAANLALSMDTSANPCENFYQYVCGNWGLDHPRPDGYIEYNWFNVKMTKVHSIIRDFLKSNTSHQPKAVQLAKDMYNGCMNTETLDKRGLKPVIAILETLGLPAYPTYINATKDFNYSAYNFDWLETVIKVKTQIGMDVLIGFNIDNGLKNSSVNRIFMGPPKTINPFLRKHTARKHHNSRRTMNHLISFMSKTTDSLYKIEHRSGKADTDKEKRAQVHKIFHAELMKLFVLEEDDINNSKLTENELHQNIILTANEYYAMNSDIVELKSDNTIDDFLNTSEYTISEIQTQTDAIVESNNGTASPIWRKYLEGLFNGSNTVLNFEQDKILVSAPDLKYMSLMAAYVAKTPPVILELYIWVKVVKAISIHTTTELRDLFQATHEQSHTHETQCFNAVNNMLGMAVSYGIADLHFFNITKPKIITMIDELKDSLAHHIGQAKWMDDNTKLATYQKIIEMKNLIGFPEWLLEEGKLEEYYEGIEVDPEKHLENMININQVNNKKMLNGLRELTKFTWTTDPTVVNAFHYNQDNSISVPMGMLQHPFFDLGLDSLNYGSLGTVLGHEIMHGFDNKGRRFDKNGNMLPWWSNNTIDLFVNMTHCFVKQYSGYYVPELNKHVDGKKTLGENIADSGSLRETLAALKHHLKKRGPEPKLPGFEHMTPEQLFFLSYGNLWCEVSTKESLRFNLEDTHPLNMFRVRGALQNSEEFARAWRCARDSAMNPTKRCVIF